MKRAIRSFVMLGLAASSLWAGAAQGAAAWVIKKDSWSAADEKKFSDFVVSIYDSGCTSVPKCMAGSGNWYRDKDPKGLEWFADCGRFPYLLRVYFAYHNNLPFQSALAASLRDPNDTNKALQYSSKGNVIVARHAAKTGINAYSFILNTVEAVYSSVYRVDSRIDVDTNQFGDMYHVGLSREYIRPGTVVYDPNGHVTTVAKVTNDGKVILMDSHPDNSVSRVPYTGAFRATSASQAGGFKNWRPIYLVGAKKGASGELVGGRIATARNSESPGYSLEQFYGDQPNNGGFSTAKWKTSDGVLGSKQYIDVVRARLSVGNVSYQPVREVSEGVDTICTMIQDRITSVQAAVTKGIDRKSMPNGRLPVNIYGTSGEWEDFSTPSRDARLKTASAEFYDHVKRMIDLYRKRDRRVIYNGNDLVGDMMNAYNEAAGRCQLSYRKSDGSTQKMSYTSVINRLYRASFDPYHCIELRWGATDSAELATCGTLTGSKMAWYKAEQRLRNSLERKYGSKMAWSLEELQGRADMGDSEESSVGSDRQPLLDVKTLLTNER